MHANCGGLRHRYAKMVRGRQLRTGTPLPFSHSLPSLTHSLSKQERDCLLAHGVSGFMLDRLKDCSDASDVRVCNACGFVADRPDRCAFCDATGTAADKKIEEVTVPHSLLLLKRELEGMHIGMRFKLHRRR